MDATVVIRLPSSEVSAALNDTVFSGAAYPFNSNMLCKSARVQGWPGEAATTNPGGYLEWPTSRMELKYSFDKDSKRNEDEDGTLFTESLSSTAENISLPTTGLSWVDSGAGELGGRELTPDVVVPYSVPMRRYTFTVLKTPYVRDIWDSLMGTVNKDPFTSKTLKSGPSGFKRFDPETMYYESYDVTLSTTGQEEGGDGIPRYDVDLNFLVRNESWNKFFDAETAQWLGIGAKVLFIGVQLKPYSVIPAISWDQLFPPYA